MVVKELARYNRLQFYKINRPLDTVRYTNVATSVGTLVIAACREGICYMGFEITASGIPVMEEIRVLWPSVTCVEDSDVATLLVPSDGILRIALQGTPFRLQVWQALVDIPLGSIWSYSRLAAHIGRPSAVRAVASAVAANPVSVLLPCHRVVRNNGDPGEYHWGRSLKKAILVVEGAIAADTGVLCF